MNISKGPGAYLVNFGGDFWTRRGRVYISGGIGLDAHSSIQRFRIHLRYVIERQR